MRKFKCQDCQHEFEVPHGTGVRGRDMNCPQCGSMNVCRADYSTENVENWAGENRAAIGPTWSRWMGFIGRGRGEPGGRGLRCRGWRRNSDQQLQKTAPGDDQETK